MMYFEPEHSPCGQVDYCDTLCPGVFSVSTPSHGGIMVRQEIEKELLSASARKIGFGRAAITAMRKIVMPLWSSVSFWTVA